MQGDVGVTVCMDVCHSSVNDQISGMIAGVLFLEQIPRKENALIEQQGACLTVVQVIGGKTGQSVV